MKKTLLVSLFILSFISSCKSPLEKEKNKWHTITLRIKGTVTDAKNGSPVSSARITIWVGMGGIWSTKDHFTDSNGQYIIEETGRLYEDWTYEWFSLEVYHEGYKGKAITSDDPNHIRLTEEWQIIDVQLEPESGV